jgi:hypothetical protein
MVKVASNRESLGIRRVASLHMFVRDLERSRDHYVKNLDFAEIAKSTPDFEAEHRARASVVEAGGARFEILPYRTLAMNTSCLSPTKASCSSSAPRRRAPSSTGRSSTTRRTSICSSSRTSAGRERAPAVSFRSTLLRDTPACSKSRTSRASPLPCRPTSTGPWSPALADTFRVTDRSRMTGALANESFKMLPHAIGNVVRKGNSSQHSSVLVW